ncbi:MAG: response regulator transcription factor [Desulfosarcinaceae bacterium]|nr:response regulator transcription factor [Desulfosarcinaceae bacterium]
MTARILVVDDTELSHDDFLRLLADAPELELVAEVENEIMAIEQARKLQPEVIIMDLNMPYSEGIAALQRVIDENPDTKVICLTMQSDLRYVDECLRAGCVGYLLKDCAHEELVQAIRSVLADKIYLSKDLQEKELKAHVVLKR